MFIRDREVGLNSKSSFASQRGQSLASVVALDDGDRAMTSPSE